ncbi:hypothetical protein ALC62_01012 [Cyphomyrmex costatus]|uniref:Uncharacterized protein n=1 Tax=Cyphomyrmex costatus TaxID=456900 RepID=A0A151IPT3_9HYME|nr:hypothetical protein ALC62_01012 [Cyphomyrmex costatus]
MFRNHVYWENEKEQYLIQLIREWSLERGYLSMKKLDDLLGKLNTIFPHIPKSYKTLLSTPKNLQIREFDDGSQIWYKSIKKNLNAMQLEQYLHVHAKIVIDINIDGLPLFKSSKMKFWPILGYLIKTKNDPFIIAIYFGRKDPQDLNTFLIEYVDEVEDLHNNGYIFNNKRYSFQIRHYICDAPARSFVKCCIESCATVYTVIIGEWFEDRVTYCIYILSSPILVHSMSDYANQLLRTFITHSSTIYGKKFVVYNVHALSHLAEECTLHGHLDQYSAFRYENFLKSIKDTLKSGYMPLHQVANRDSERNTSIPIILEINGQEIKLSKKQTPRTEVLYGVHYKRISIDNVVLHTGKKDSCLLTTSNEVIILEDIICNENVISLLGRLFQQTNDFYTYPLASFVLDIVTVSQLSENTKIFSLSEIKAKCWLMPDHDSFLCVPLLHTLTIFQALQ